VHQYRTTAALDMALALKKHVNRFVALAKWLEMKQSSC
jgi:hypothetical protein